MICDGLGHGALAREAADLALATAGDRLTQSPDEILAACGAALAGTRGAALAVVRLDERGWLEAISVGNIEGGIATGAAVRAVGSQPGVVGRPSELHTPRVNRMPMLAGARLLLATDGVLAPLAELRAPLPADFPLWSLAQRVFDSPCRVDDATVIVVG